MITLSTPTIYSLEITPNCNNNCFACSNVFDRNNKPLSVFDWRKVISHISSHAEILKITGGEPTLHPEFEEIVQFIADRNINFTLFTNARWSNPDSVIHLLKSTPQSKGLLISLHGPNATSHESFTNTNNSFKQTCENIRLASAAGLRVHISTIITKYNFDRIQTIAVIAKGVGAKCVVFNRYIGFESPDIKSEEWQLRKAINTIEQLNNQLSDIRLRYGNCFPQCFISSSSTGCWAGIAYCTIDPWGNLRPCNHSPTIAGNILEEPIEKIWNNEIMNKWRSLLPGQCKQCAELGTCHGGCRAQAEISGINQDPLIRKPINNKQRQSPVVLDLYENSYPLLQCNIESEPFGYALIRGHTIIPVKAEAKQILRNINGNRTLQQIQDELGQDALDFIGSLYLHGLISLETQPSSIEFR